METVKEKSLLSFRPSSFDQYIGQVRAKKILERYISEMQKRKLVFPHILIYGKPGTGKTTLARIISNQLGVAFYENMAQKNIQIGSFLRDLNKTNGGVVFFDEVHGFSRESVEQLHAVMEDFKYGNTDIPRFTLIGATTEIGEILRTRKPFYDRFKIIIELEDYNIPDLITIAKQYREKLFPEDQLDESIYKIIALNCRATPRHLIRLLESTVYFGGDIREVFYIFNILKNGYTTKDYKLLELLNREERCIGLQEISICLDMPKETYQYEIEPFILKNGMISRTSRGRKITDMGKLLLKELEVLI